MRHWGPFYSEFEFTSVVTKGPICSRFCLDMQTMRSLPVLVTCEPYNLERLQDQLNVYWKQQAHNTWLLKGDRNTDFFHAFTSKRKTRNYVRKLWDDNENVVEGKHLRNFITNQYIELFTSPGDDQFDEVLNLESHKT
jgi:hypothetical protein